MTRGNVLLLGLAALFALGGVGYGLFQRFGFQGAQAGIAAQAPLALIGLVWTVSYVLRVVSGRTTFMEQRRRYRAGYNAATAEALLRRFESLSPDEQKKLLEDVGQASDQTTAEPRGV